MHEMVHESMVLMCLYRHWCLQDRCRYYLHLTLLVVVVKSLNFDSQFYGVERAQDLVMLQHVIVTQQVIDVGYWLFLPSIYHISKHYLV